jgi:hypothetical protein
MSRELRVSSIESRGDQDSGSRFTVAVAAPLETCCLKLATTTYFYLRAAATLEE